MLQSLAPDRPDHRHRLGRGAARPETERRELPDELDAAPSSLLAPVSRHVEGRSSIPLARTHGTFTVSLRALHQCFRRPAIVRRTSGYSKLLAGFLEMNLSLNGSVVVRFISPFVAPAHHWIHL